MQSWSWLIFGLLSALFAALVAIFGKLGLGKIDTTLATTARAAVMFVFLLLTTGFMGKLSGLGSIDAKGWFYIILAGVAGALSWLCYFWALRIGRASQVAPIDRLSVVFVIILAALFLGEKIGWKSGVGATLVTVGAILIALA